MVRPEDGAISGQIVKVVHDNRNKQVNHDEATEEDKANKVEIGCIAATTLIWVEQLSGG